MRYITSLSIFKLLVMLIGAFWLGPGFLADPGFAHAADERLFGDSFTKRPVAVLGPDRYVGVGDPQQIEGAQSSAPGLQVLRFHWVLADKPAGSAAMLQDSGVTSVRLVPDVKGIYTVELVVSAGGAYSSPARLTIRAFENFGIDSDGDGIPDAVEIALGLDPFNPDSFGDGIWDGDRDLDGDGLTVLQELLLGTDPLNPDTNGNGISDGDEDFDLDGLTNLQEFAIGTHPLIADTDGDDWPDGAEVDAGSDPLSPDSVPLLFGGRLAPTATLVRPGMSLGGEAGSSTFIATPPAVTLVRPGENPSDGPPSTFVAGPPMVTIVRPGEAEPGDAPSTFVARPPFLTLVRPGTGDEQSATSTVIANPPIEIEYED